MLALKLDQKNYVIDSLIPTKEQNIFLITVFAEITKGVTLSFNNHSNDKYKSDRILFDDFISIKKYLDTLIYNDLG